VIVDSSALVAVALRERPAADMLVRALDEERHEIGIGAPTPVESIRSSNRDWAPAPRVSCTG